MLTPLTERLLRRIERSGPITFADFMSVALYDPDDGFYERGGPVGAGAVGTRGDFVTSPHVSPVFGTLLARQVEDFDAALGAPDPFTVVDAGAGDGTLAQQLARGIGDETRARTRFVLAERTAAHRTLAAARPLGPAARQIADVAELAPGSVEGCIVANELLDNLPFHLLRGTEDGVVELFVAAGRDGAPLDLVEGAVSASDVGRLAPPLGPGEEAAVPTGAVAFVEAATVVLRRGYVLLIDYAAPAASVEGAAVHGYRGQGVVADVLAHPGSTDITAGVDVEVVSARASVAGLRVWGPVTQRDALVALGLAGELEALRQEQVADLEQGRGTQAVRAYSARTAAAMLAARGGLGDFAVLCLGKNVGGAPPRCMAGSSVDAVPEEGQVP